jgi:hypothetical protein
MHVFLTLALLVSKWSASHSSHFTHGESIPSSHWIRGWVASRAGLYAVERRKILSLLGLKVDTLAVQAIASHYIDCTILALCLKSGKILNRGYVEFKQNYIPLFITNTFFSI